MPRRARQPMRISGGSTTEAASSIHLPFVKILGEFTAVPRATRLRRRAGRGHRRGTCRSRLGRRGRVVRARRRHARDQCCRLLPAPHAVAHQHERPPTAPRRRRNEKRCMRHARPSSVRRRALPRATCPSRLLAAGADLARPDLRSPGRERGSGSDGHGPTPMTVETGGFASLVGVRR